MLLGKHFPPVSLACEDPQLEQQARQLSYELGIPLRSYTDETESDFILVIQPENPHYRLELREAGSRARFHIDFIDGALGYRVRHGGGRKQALGRAVGLKSGYLPSIVDATAGLGRDAFVLAAMGCQITMIERCPVIAALLRNGLERGKLSTDVTAKLIHHMRLIEGDAIDWLTHLQTHEYPEVIYLDPMYPQRDKSALVKKEMRWLRRIAGDDLDAPRLLDCALSSATRRVVVKRPRLAPRVIGPEPTLNILSENTRYDIYLIRA